MPPKPTCKVVKRAGQKGARIAPKGCVVRTDEDAAGVKVRRNKAGVVKVKRKTGEDDFRLTVSYSPKFPEMAKTNGVLTAGDRVRYGRDHNMLYDTGGNDDADESCSFNTVKYPGGPEEGKGSLTQ